MPVEPLDRIQSLLKSVTSLREDCLHSHAENAPNFNLFRILDVEEKEVSTHSAFLVHLLTPGEAHAQGDLFLHRFLSEIGREELASFDGWTISRELPFDRGRLDIVLQSAKASAIIVVENKIGTEDHANQLNAYRWWLDAPRRRRSFKTRLLLYLTPTGDLAKNAQREIIYERISYSEHISRWLRSCLDKVNPARVKEAIKTYLLTISNLNTKTLMKDDLDDRILSLIKTPADQTAALREPLIKEWWA